MGGQVGQLRRAAALVGDAPLDGLFLSDHYGVAVDVTALPFSRRPMTRP